MFFGGWLSHKRAVYFLNFTVLSLALVGGYETSLYTTKVCGCSGFSDYSSLLHFPRGVLHCIGK